MAGGISSAPAGFRPTARPGIETGPGIIRYASSPQDSAASRRSAEALLSVIDFPNKNRLRGKDGALRGGYRGCTGSVQVACRGRRSRDSGESLSAIGEISKLRGPASTCHKYILENQRHIYYLQFPSLAGEGALGIPLSNRREFRSGRCRRWLG